MEQAQTDFRPKSLDNVIEGEATATDPDAGAKQEADADKPGEQSQKTTDADGAKAEGANAEGTKPESDGGTDDPKGEKTDPGTTPAPEDKSKKSDPDADFVPKAALLAERQKRQELAARVEGLERDKKRPDPEQDPEGAAEFERREKADAAFKDRVAMSQEVMRDAHADYDEVEAVFMEAAENNRDLQTQLFNHPFPARFAYQQGQKITEALKAGGGGDASQLSQLAKTVDHLAQMVAQLTGNAGGKDGDGGEASTEGAGDAAAGSGKIPESLADEPSAGATPAKKFAGPKPLKQILG